MSRGFSLTLEPAKGKLHDFSATIAGRLVLSGDASQPRSYATSTLPADQVEVRIVVSGVIGAQYILTVDFPGEDDGFVWRYTLSAPLHSVVFHV